MNSAGFNRATHFSVVWAVMLSFITIVEWRSLDREPLKPDIFSPFIQRHIDIVPAQVSGPLARQATKESQYVVELDFNGPLFLFVFFVPIVFFHALAALIQRLTGS